jgi:S-adenosylmethionine-diacylgycerolhomoserine-N-methlytransferase
MTALNRALGEGQVLLRMLRGQSPRAAATRAPAGFYAPQAERYDAFRSRLLHGREELITLLGLEPGMRVVELGCGTGASLGFLGATLDGLARYDMVDLCPALAGAGQAARRRTAQRRRA